MHQRKIQMSISPKKSEHTGRMFRGRDTGAYFLVKKLVHQLGVMLTELCSTTAGAGAVPKEQGEGNIYFHHRPTYFSGTSNGRLYLLGP